LVKRSAVILKAASGATTRSIAAASGQRRDTVQRWRDRWYASQAEREQAENDKALRQVIEQTLADGPRQGAPATFSAEQIVQIVALACEVPEASGYPVSHWTPREVRQEAIKRGIVDQISERQVGRFLERGRSQAASQPLLAQYDGKGCADFRPTSGNGLYDLCPGYRRLCPRGTYSER
jgi:putative transposase